MLNISYNFCCCWCCSFCRLDFKEPWRKEVFLFLILFLCFIFRAFFVCMLQFFVCFSFFVLLNRFVFAFFFSFFIRIYIWIYMHVCYSVSFFSLFSHSFWLSAWFRVHFCESSMQRFELPIIGFTFVFFATTTAAASFFCCCCCCSIGDYWNLELLLLLVFFCLFQCDWICWSRFYELLFIFLFFLSFLFCFVVESHMVHKSFVERSLYPHNTWKWKPKRKIN